MKNLLLLMTVSAGLTFGAVLLAADPPVLDTNQSQHRSADSMPSDHCMRCHGMGLGKAPVAPAHCQNQSDCLSCHI